MRTLGKLVGHIPARGGSKRVPAKNLRYLAGKPMLTYAIDCARESGVFDEIFVNTESPAIAALAGQCGVKVYRRPEHLGSDATTGDDFTADFMETMKPSTLVMVSPVCPLVQPADVRETVELFRNSDCDTLITCHDTRMQTFCEGRPVNVDPAGPLAPSQQNPVVQILNWAVTIWDVPSFLESYRTRRNGYIGTQRLLHPIDPVRTLKISHEEDFQMAELLLRARAFTNATQGEPARFWSPDDGTPWRAVPIQP